MIRVLILDDDKLARKGIISIVPWKEFGMEVAGEASNGINGLEFLEKQGADLVVVDLNLPLMNGLDFMKASRKRWPRLEYVVLSFHEDFESVQAALRLGALDYISKMRLDSEDCGKVFGRIAEIMRKTDAEAPEPVKDEEVPLDYELWQKQISGWMSFKWLFSNVEMEKSIGQLKSSGPSSRQLEHLLVRLQGRIKDAYPWAPVCRIPDRAEKIELEEALSWVREQKKSILEEVERNTFITEPSVQILRLTMYTESHLNPALTLNEAAYRCSLSRSAFASYFKKITGLTYNQFVRMERAYAAKQILLHAADFPKNIASMVGYEDEKYFAQLFTGIWGISPYSFYQRRKEFM